MAYYLLPRFRHFNQKMNCIENINCIDKMNCIENINK